MKTLKANLEKKGDRLLLAAVLYFYGVLGSLALTASVKESPLCILISWTFVFMTCVEFFICALHEKIQE